MKSEVSGTGSGTESDLGQSARNLPDMNAHALTIVVAGVVKEDQITEDKRVYIVRVNKVGILGTHFHSTEVSFTYHPPWNYRIPIQQVETYVKS